MATNIEQAGYAVGHLRMNGPGIMVRHRSKLEITKRNLEKDPSYFRPMSDALQTILDHPEMTIDITKRLRDNGRFLLGIARSQQGIDGLLYGEGRNYRDNGAIASLKIAAWLNPHRIQGGFSDDELAGLILDKSLKDVNRTGDTDNGIPVDNMTRITNLEGVRTRPLDFSYKEHRDLRQVEELDVDPDMRELLVDAVSAQHSYLRTRGTDYPITLFEYDLTKSVILS